MTTDALLEVPVPGVVVLVGPAGAGKSTLAARLFRPDEILSSDELRGAIRGDPTDQSISRVAFGILHRELIKRLADGRLVVVDATNLTRAARAAILSRAGLSRVPAVAVVLVAPAAAVHARNASRPSRSVPPAVVDHQLEAAAALGDGPAAITARLLAEGFAGVSIVDAASFASLDRVAIVRRPRRAS